MQFAQEYVGMVFLVPLTSSPAVSACRVKAFRRGWPWRTCKCGHEKHSFVRLRPLVEMQEVSWIKVRQNHSPQGAVLTKRVWWMDTTEHGRNRQDGETHR